jgi:hypothetical protein
MTGPVIVPTPVDPAKPINDYAISLIRTGVPYLVGAGSAYLASKGLHVPASDAGLVDPILAAGLGTLYYGAVRAAERRWPKVGVLLGWVAKIAYKKVV